jgi:hypothetical protein
VSRKLSPPSKGGDAGEVLKKRNFNFKIYSDGLGMEKRRFYKVILYYERI